MGQVQFYDGKILLIGGEVAMDPACCCEEPGGSSEYTPCEPEPEPCPDDCMECSIEYNVNASGFSGDCGPEKNGQWYMFNPSFGFECQWQGEDGDVEVNMYCENGKWKIAIRLISSEFCFHNPDVFEVPVDGACPPETGWTKVSGPSTGGSVTLTPA